MPGKVIPFQVSPPSVDRKTLSDSIAAKMFFWFLGSITTSTAGHRSVMALHPQVAGGYCVQLAPPSVERHNPSSGGTLSVMPASAPLRLRATVTPANIWIGGLD